MHTNIQPVVLSGGSGTRLWPLSREAYPKQLIALYDQHSLLQNTVQRLGNLSIAEPIIICNEAHRFLVAEQFSELGIKLDSIILEPFGRNTAPAVAIAALHALAKNPKSILLILPADHVIQENEVFQQAVTQALPHVEAGMLATFGVVPRYPHTGYGYIHRGKPLVGCGFKVERFVEKPNKETAENYVKEGHYYWNSGMFMFTAAAYIQALEQYVPDILSFCRQAVQGEHPDLNFIRLNEGAFASCPNISIDYAVMEKADNVAVIPLDAGWSDVGSWSALCEVGQKDASGNVVHGDVVLEGVSGSYVRAESRLLAVVGVSDHVVVETQDAVLVAHKDASEQVKQIVNKLIKSGRRERLYHTMQYRPWGHHELLVEGLGFEVRRVIINPGQHITLQRHAKRSEHWVVVSGIADIMADNKQHHLSANQSFYVPEGMAHSITNKGAEPLVFIEVQVGECLKDDDIQRLE